MFRILLAIQVIVVVVAATTAQGEALFVSKPFSEAKGFTEGIEGPACDKAGNIFAVNFAKQQTIGKVTPVARPRSM